MSERPLEGIPHVGVLVLAQRSSQATKALFRNTWRTSVFDVLKGATGIQAWSYLDAAIGLGDPVLLEDRNDLTWLGRPLEGHSPYMQIMASERLRERLNEIRKIADKRDSSQE